jgi:hypothetical protein
MEHIEAQIPLVIQGTPNVVYNYVYINELIIRTEFGKYITANAWFRYYRIDEDGNRYEAPLEMGRPMLSIPDLNQVMGEVEGGMDLKNGVESAFIGLAMMQGLV